MFVKLKSTPKVVNRISHERAGAEGLRERDLLAHPLLSSLTESSRCAVACGALPTSERRHRPLLSHAPSELLGMSAPSGERRLFSLLSRGMLGLLLPSFVTEHGFVFGHS